MAVAEAGCISYLVVVSWEDLTIILMISDNLYVNQYSMGNLGF